MVSLSQAPPSASPSAMTTTTAWCPTGLPVTNQGGVSVHFGNNTLEHKDGYIAALIIDKEQAGTELCQA